MSIKQLAGQTVFYGVSNIVSKFLNLLLTPFYLLVLMDTVSFGAMSSVYAYITFINVLLTYGMETTFFRFAKQGQEKAVLSMSMISLLVSSTFAFIVFVLLRTPAINSSQGVMAGLSGHPNFYIYIVLVLVFDAITAIPYAQLRLEGRPIRYAIIRIANILTILFFNVFFLWLGPKLYASGLHFMPNARTGSDQLGFIYLANVMGSGMTLLLFLPQIISINWKINWTLWKQLLTYSLPLVVFGLAGMVNETLDRAWFLPTYLHMSMHDKQEALSIYSANYKMAIFITMFIQAFKMGAEPFFFKQAEGQHPQKVYARIMKLFVVLLCVMFLFVSLFLNIWKIFLVKNTFYQQGLFIVPVLLLANVFLGIYYNLTIWFKITDRTRTGAAITILTALLAWGFNAWWIPRLGYFGAALATMVCYFIQMVVCYVLGQKYYPVPYHLPRILAYILSAVAVYYVFSFLANHLLSPGAPYALTPSTLAVGLLFFFSYLWFVLKMEKREFVKLPFVGKYVNKL
ncbi:Membrane protein involved in the export of O-antigen and teichoic acid [Chitinophaga costaii]|uniref:Membrane protein involved in the export of O-antigen and teichoic acid n=1 Tax=Chitinophaga costaii TaxID=1335309 RepID=A0A1C4DW08_9BACT|nr:polysaccharide biosynthesis C-terminal domain-containing protein [Chitinophaga costaii]SCC35425.1 Membrane protein involved in the export of O-antigen and teichoic acid [Chitinophaga costaii]